jgi:hypothetical protein
VSSFHFAMPPGTLLSSAASSSPERRKSAVWRHAGIILLAVVLSYSSSLHAPFLFDDTGAVVKNPTIRDLTSSAIWKPPTDGSTTTGRPVVNVSFAINYALSGERTWSYHALNVTIHALAALVLMGIVRRTLSRGRRAPAVSLGHDIDSAWAATFAALLWALHPLQTESVICIAQRTESLCALFYLLTLYAFIRGIDDEVPAGGGETATRSKVPIHGFVVSDTLAPRGWLTLSVLF